MTGYLLDTNVISELRRIDRANVNLVAWSHITPIAQMYLSVVTVLEVEQGILLLERKDARQALHIRTWLDNEILVNFKERILEVDLKVAFACAKLHVPDPRPERDALIAATALSNGLTVVSNNESDFAPMGIPFMNPWKSRAVS